MPKKQLITFVIIDVILMVAVIIAVFRHVRVLYAMMAFILLSCLNGIYLIMKVLKRPSA
jgi:hypothetical protein